LASFVTLLDPGPHSLWALKIGRNCIGTISEDSIFITENPKVVQGSKHLENVDATRLKKPLRKDFRELRIKHCTILLLYNFYLYIKCG
jgi:hypothetical protein